MKDLADCRLYTFVDLAYLKDHDPVDVARQLCQGGSDIIQLRAKHSTQDEIRCLGESILTVTRSHQVPFVINDYPEVALELGAEFCHLGQEDFFERNVASGQHRDYCPSHPGPRLGLSSHAPSQARRAIAAGADYIAVGPVYATGSKPGRAPVTLDYVRWAAENVTTPWFAIGGITIQNVRTVLEAGARRVCVLSAILTAPDIRAACLAFKERLN